MLNILLKSKVLVSITLVSLMILGTLFVYIPIVTEQNTINTVIRNSENTVEQIKLNRAYYVKNVVKDIKKYAPNISFDYNHEGEDGKLPFPTTTVHDLSKIFSEKTGLMFEFYSQYPFKPKASRVLTKQQQEALEYINKDEHNTWVKRDTIDGKPVLRVGVVDYMTDISCVKCHNSHKDKTWKEDYWKLGDKRGILEVITPLEEDLKANKMMRDKILAFIAIALLILVIYYSVMLLKRENELLTANEFLDAKVKEEVEKNLEKEKLLVQQSRTAAMGEMIAAITHQWKQPLNTISMANSGIGLHVSMEDFDSKYLNEQTSCIDDQIQYMNTTLNDFKNFFKIQPKSCFDIGNNVNEVIRLIGKVYEVQKINIVTDFKEKIYVDGYPNEFNQVLINILNNARDVILEKDPDIKDIVIKTYKEGNTAVMTITDYAGGIPEDIIHNIFDPYVTTKCDEKGTGIGLDMSRSIIKKVNGTLEVKNVITRIGDIGYKGAQFTIKLDKCN
jgi:signal transduction histidine kinase